MKFNARAVAVLALLAVGSVHAVEQALPPGEFVATGNLVALALEKYRTAHGFYPKNLEELRPEFTNIPSSDLGKPAMFVYSRKGEKSYRLLFRYFAPAQTTCSYFPENSAGDWRCSSAD